MASTMLRIGSTGPDVVAIQNALNLALTPSPGLQADGIFGPKTDRAVRAYQTQRSIGVDGIVGPVTRCVLRGVPRRTPPKLHLVRLVPQPTPSTCWAAATAMMKNSTPQQIIDSTPEHLKTSSGGARNFSETADNVSGNEEFARVHHLQYYAPQSWAVSGSRGSSCTAR
jgi:peptidoglycan hydrolase-like protein with peptidoglycan-binding domain